MFQTIGRISYHFMSNAASLSLKLVAIPDVKLFLNYSFPKFVYMGTFVNGEIHMKYVAYPICFKPYTVSWTAYFLGSQCHSQMFFIYGDIIVHKVFGKILRFVQIGPIGL